MGSVKLVPSPRGSRPGAFLTAWGLPTDAASTFKRRKLTRRGLIVESGRTGRTEQHALCRMEHEMSQRTYSQAEVDALVAAAQAAASKAGPAPTIKFAEPNAEGQPYKAGGGFSVYGINRQFPVTYYAESWKTLLGMKDEILAFIEAHQADVERVKAYNATSARKAEAAAHKAAGKAA